MEPQMRVEGLKETLQALRRLGDKETPRAIRDANKRSAQRVVDIALPNVPVRTGRLQGSVRALGSQKAGTAVAGKAKVPYAAAIHWGRKRGGVIPARPFLWDAARQAAGSDLPAIYEAELRQAINRTVD